MKSKSVLSVVFLVMLIVGGCGTKEQSQPNKDDVSQLNFKKLKIIQLLLLQWRIMIRLKWSYIQLLLQIR